MSRCAACGVWLAGVIPVGRPAATPAGGPLGILLRWCRVVPALALALGLAAGWGAYARRTDLRADAYAAAELALARGDTSTAAASLERAGDYRDAAARHRGLAVALAPYQVAYRDALAALGAGEPGAAVVLLTSIVRDEPAYEDAAELLELARERRRADLVTEVEQAAARGDWLAAETLLAGLVAEHPDPALAAELREIRRRRSPLLFTLDGSIRMATPEGSDPSVILDGRSARYPAWSPDRRLVAFYAPAGGTEIAFDLWVVGRDGGGRRLIAEHVSPESFAAWSPGGDRIAYVGARRLAVDGREGTTSVHVADLATGATTDLTESSAHQARSPSWSPDGTRVAFVSRDLGGRGSSATWRQIGRVQVADLERGTVADVTGERLGFVEHVAWSPTGDHLALWVRQLASSFQETTITTIHLLDLPSGALTEVTGRSRMVGRPVWAPDGETLAYLDGDRVVGLHRLDGTSRAITLTVAVLPALSWSPDGASLIAPGASPPMGSPVISIADGTVGLLFPLPWDLSSELVGPPRWGGGWPVAPVFSPTSEGTALDHR